MGGGCLRHTSFVGDEKATIVKWVLCFLKHSDDTRMLVKVNRNSGGDGSGR